MKCQFKSHNNVLLLLLHNNVQLRIMKGYNRDVFEDKLRSLDWAKVTSLKNVNDSWKTFHDMFLQILDSVGPVKMIVLNRGRNNGLQGIYIKNYKCQRQSMETVQEAKNF